MHARTIVRHSTDLFKILLGNMSRSAISDRVLLLLLRHLLRTHFLHFDRTLIDGNALFGPLLN